MTSPSQPPLDYSPPSSSGSSRDELPADLVSPIPDLTETVNMLTDDYTSFPQPTTDNSWPSTFYGVDYSQTQHPAAHVYEDDLKPSNLGDADGWLSTKPTSTFGFDGSLSQDFEQLQGHANPFANMSTAMLQSFLSRADLYLDSPLTSTLQGHDASGQHDTATISASTQALFHQPLEDKADPAGLQVEVRRSPSPLLELEADDLISLLSTSSEDLEPMTRPRRASDGGEPSRSTATNDRPRRMSALLPIEEKLLRAQATQGLSKSDKRRVQNKLAQRAFRARSKVANRNAHGRLEHLEELTEQQAARIVKMNELIGRLQKENTGLKAVKFEQAMHGMTVS